VQRRRPAPAPAGRASSRLAQLAVSSPPALHKHDRVTLILRVFYCSAVNTSSHSIWILCIHI
jgi:hypothetical protein